MKKNTTIIASILAVLSIVLIGCSAGSQSDKKTNFRVINAVPDVASLDFFIDFKPYLNDIGYLESSGYSDIESDSHKITASVSGSFTPLVDTTATFSDKLDYSLFVFGPSTKSAYLLTQDDNDPPSEDTARVRVLNAASVNRSIDVYILGATENLLDSAPATKSLSYRTMSKYLLSSQGTYTIVVTDKGTKDVLGSLPAAEISGDSVYTVLVSDSAVDGSKPKIVLLKDR